MLVYLKRFLLPSLYWLKNALLTAAVMPVKVLECKPDLKQFKITPSVISVQVCTSILLCQINSILFKLKQMDLNDIKMEHLI